MNKILFLLFFSFSILFANNINEQKVDLFFGNGINTSFKDALKTTDKLNNVLLGRNIALRNTFFDKDKESDYRYDNNLSYNNTFGGFYDFVEAGIQKDIMLGCYVTDFTGSLEEEIKLAEMTQEAKDQLLLRIINGETNCNIMKGIEEYDITTQLNGYRKSLNQGHRVMAVVHSQGNLFLNEVGKRLENWEKDYIEAYGIATPADTLFKSNNEPALNNYITSDQDSIKNVGLNVNHTLTETEKSIYDIGLLDFKSGHFIINYLQIPSTRDLIVQGIEGKTKKLLNLPSMFKFTPAANYCESIPIIHKNKDESYFGLVFNENGKVNSIGLNVVMNNRYLNGVIELTEDPINCYSDLEEIDFIKREKGLEQDITILNIENKGYVIKGEMNGYESNKTYVGEINNTETGEKIESVKFTKLAGDFFEVSFPMKTNGNFYFKLKSDSKNSNEIFINIQEITFNDLLTLSAKLNKIIIEGFFDFNALNYNIKLKNENNELIFEKSLSNININHVEVIPNLKKGIYTVEVEKENVYGEKVTLTRNQSLIIDLESILIDYFEIKYISADTTKLHNTYRVYVNFKLKNLETNMKYYLINNLTGQKSYVSPGSIGYSFTNGDKFNYSLIIEDNEGNILLNKNQEKIIDEPLIFTNSLLNFQTYENCNDINNASFRISNYNALNEDIYEIFIDNKLIYANEKLPDLPISGINIKELNEVKFKIRNTRTEKEYIKTFKNNFNIQDTKCISTLREMKEPFYYSTVKDINNKISKVKTKTIYTEDSSTPGKIEIYINGLLKKTYDFNQIQDLKLNPDNQEFEVDGTKTVKFEIKLYDIYGFNYLVKVHTRYFVY